MQNLLLKTPYKFKKSYGGTPEPQTTQDAPWLHGPSLNPLQLRSPFGPHKPIQCTAYREISNQMGTYFVYLDISNTTGNPVRGIGTLDREIRFISVQIIHE